MPSSARIQYGSPCTAVISTLKRIWNRIWNRHWNTPPEHHFWLYDQLSRGNVDAIYQLGPGTGINLGERYDYAVSRFSFY